MILWAFVDFKYLRSVLPLCLMHSIVPPLNFPAFVEPLPKEKRELWESVYPPKYFHWKAILELMLTDKSRGSICFETISHMFVHHSYEHLLNNLSAAVIFGYPVFRRCGAAYFYSLFVAGGVAASSPEGEKLLKSFAVDSSTKSSARKPSNINDMLSSTIEGLAEEVSSMFKRLVSKSGIQKYYCGSSGAVCALMGGSLAFELSNLCASLAGRLDDEEAIHPKGKKVPKRVFSRLARASSSVLGLSIMTDFAHMEFFQLRNDEIAAASSSWWSRLTPKNQADRAAHLQGLGFGFVVGACSLLCTSRGRRKMRL